MPLDDTKRDAWERSELPGFDDMYKHWHYAMRNHDMADAAIFGNRCAAPQAYFGYVRSRSTPMTLSEIQEDYHLGTTQAPQA